MRFEIRFFDAQSGQVVVDEAEAGSEAQLRLNWNEEAGVLLSIVPSKAKPSGLHVAGQGSGLDVQWWCRELRTLLGAGMTVVEALETLNAQQSSGERAVVQARLLRSLREGQSLSKAMRSADVFPAVLIAGVTASERTSTLVSALDDYLRYAAVLEQLRKQVVSAAIYPAIVSSLGALIALFLLLYVVPKFSRMYGDFHGQASAVTEIMISLSRLLRDESESLMFAVGLVALLIVWGWRSGVLKRAGIAGLTRIKPLERQWNHFRLAKLYQSLALMFRGGYTLDDALEVCEGLALGGGVAAGLPKARFALRQGRSVSVAFGEAGLTETVSQRLLAVGERTGGFDAVLQTIAERHGEAFTIFVERATRIVEPLLLLTVALVVGGIVVMMYMPIFDIANTVRG